MEKCSDCGIVSCSNHMELHRGGKKSMLIFLHQTRFDEFYLRILRFLAEIDIMYAENATRFILQASGYGFGDVKTTYKFYA